MSIPGLSLKKASLSDCELLLSWTNEPDTRKNSLNSELISLETHTKWLTQILQDESVSLYILYLENIPVGQVRLNCTDKQAKISYSIAKEYRGRGFGSEVIRMLESIITVERPYLTKMVAEVKFMNVPSRKIFENNGYSKTQENISTQVILYSKPLDINP